MIKRLGGLTLAMLSVAAAGPPMVTKLVRPMTSIYDKAGNPQGRVDSSTIKTPAEIVDYSDRDQVGIRGADGKTIYLRPSEIETKNETGPCLQVASASEASGRHVAASAGIHSGMSSSSTACVRK